MTANETQVLSQRIGDWMGEQDKFAKSLGIKIDKVGPGYCRASMCVREDMVNAVGITHGGATFTLADLAFAVACNSHGRVAVALSATISFPAASKAGDNLVAEAREETCSNRTGFYRVEVKRDDGKLVGIFSGSVFRRDEDASKYIC